MQGTDDPEGAKGQRFTADYTVRVVTGSQHEDADEQLESKTSLLHPAQGIITIWQATALGGRSMNRLKNVTDPLTRRRRPTNENRESLLLFLNRPATAVDSDKDPQRLIQGYLFVENLAKEPSRFHQVDVGPHGFELLKELFGVRTSRPICCSVVPLCVYPFLLEQPGKVLVIE